MADKAGYDKILGYTVDIVSSYVSNSDLEIGEVSKLIEGVHKTLSSLDGDVTGGMAERPQPAVPIKRSITPDYLICLEDGKKLKMLKRHLRSAYGMSPDDYRERWGLPADYPMVAPSYAERRSKLAKDIGLGTKPR